MTLNAFILCDLLWKVQKHHPANREGSFNSYEGGLHCSWLTDSARFTKLSHLTYQSELLITNYVFREDINISMLQESLIPLVWGWSVWTLASLLHAHHWFFFHSVSLYTIKVLLFYVFAVGFNSILLFKKYNIV